MQSLVNSSMSKVNLVDCGSPVVIRNFVKRRMRHGQHSWVMELVGHVLRVEIN